MDVVTLEVLPVWGQMMFSRCYFKCMPYSYFLLFLQCFVQFHACVFSRLGVSTSLQPYGLQSSKLLCPWNYPCKNTGVGCHFLLQRIFPTQVLHPHLLHWKVDSLSETLRKLISILFTKFWNEQTNNPTLQLYFDRLAFSQFLRFFSHYAFAFAKIWELL